jgi:biotin carboxyl carrier protein
LKAGTSRHNSVSSPRTSRLQPANGPSPSSEEAYASTVIPVGVATAVRQDIPVRISALGSVTPLNTVTVRPRVDGQLMEVGFQEGQFVRKGDLLAVIDPRPFQVQLEQAQGQLAKDEAQLANAKTQLARYQLLLSQDSIARSNVDDSAATVAQLESTLQVDQAAINNAKLNLTYSRVTSPLNGRVGLRLVDVGNIVNASSQTGLVVITEVEPIAVLFTVIAQWFVTLFAGRPADALHRFNGAYVRYTTQVYSYLFLVTNEFPGFVGAPGSYPVDLHIAPPERQNRWKTGFRLILAFPALIVTSGVVSVSP